MKLKCAGIIPAVFLSALVLQGCSEGVSSGPETADCKIDDGADVTLECGTVYPVTASFLVGFEEETETGMVLEPIPEGDKVAFAVSFRVTSNERKIELGNAIAEGWVVCDRYLYQVWMKDSSGSFVDGFTPLKDGPLSGSIAFVPVYPGVAPCTTDISYKMQYYEALESAYAFVHDDGGFRIYYGDPAVPRALRFTLPEVMDYYELW